MMTPGSDGDSSPSSQPAAELRRLAEVIAAQDSDDADPQAAREASAGLARIMLSEQYSEQYQGVFPPPSYLREFDTVVANGAERAFALTEREQLHRHECDTKVVDVDVERVRADIKDRRLVILLVALLAIAGLIATVVLAALGLPVSAGLVGGGSILVSALGGSAFLRKRPSESKEN